MSKKTILIFIGVLANATIIMAQMPDKVGIKVGYGSSIADFDYQSSIFSSGIQDAYLALDTALVVEWGITSWLDVRGEPGLVHRGYKRDLTSFFYPFGSKGLSQVRMRYFSLPVLARVQPFSWSVSPFIEAGPRLDVLLSREINDGGSYERQAFEDYNTVTGGPSMGLGVDLGVLFSPVNVAIGGRFNWDAFNSYSDEFDKN